MRLYYFQQKRQLCERCKLVLVVLSVCLREQIPACSFGRALMISVTGRNLVFLLVNFLLDELDQKLRVVDIESDEISPPDASFPL